MIKIIAYVIANTPQPIAHIKSNVLETVFIIYL